MLLGFFRYIKYKKENPEPPPADGTKVISMALYGNKPVYTMGAIRNAQLLPVIYPGWTLRVYMADPKSANASLNVPARITSKLRVLGVQIVYVNGSLLQYPQQWGYLVADDPDVEVFLVRSPHARLSDREATAVQLWLKNWQPFHCIRDHPSHADVVLKDFLWGARTKGLQKLLGAPLSQLMVPSTVRTILERDGRWHEGASFLPDLLWPLVEMYALCHDSVSCLKWKNSDPFPVPRTNASAEFVGRTYTQHQEPEASKVVPWTPVPECVGKKSPISTKPAYILYPGEMVKRPR
jgi:hypothetical protein